MSSRHILDEERINSASIVTLCFLPESGCCPFKELPLRREMVWHHTPETLRLALGMEVCIYPKPLWVRCSEYHIDGPRIACIWNGSLETGDIQPSIAPSFLLHVRDTYSGFRAKPTHYVLLRSLEPAQDCPGYRGAQDFQDTSSHNPCNYQTCPRTSRTALPVQYQQNQSVSSRHRTTHFSLADLTAEANHPPHRGSLLAVLNSSVTGPLRQLSLLRGETAMGCKVSVVGEPAGPGIWRRRLQSRRRVGPCRSAWSFRYQDRGSRGVRV